MLEFTPGDASPNLYDYEPQPTQHNDPLPREVIVNGIPESELIQLAQQEPDQEIYGVLFEHHRAAVARNVLWTPHRDDVVGDTYIRGWNGLPDFSDYGAGLQPWLRRIAYNRAVDLWRKDERLAVRLTDPLNEDTEMHDIADPTPAKDLVHVLSQVTQQANPGSIERVLAIVEQEVGLDAARFLLTVGIEGKQLGEYAHLAGVAPMTANTRARRIRHKLGRQTVLRTVVAALETEGML